MVLKSASSKMCVLFAFFYTQLYNMDLRVHVLFQLKMNHGYLPLPLHSVMYNDNRSKKKVGQITFFSKNKEEFAQSNLYSLMNRSK